MSRVRVVPSKADVTITVTSPLRHLCPFVDEVDNGTVTITWRAKGKTFELHSLRAYLDGWKDSEISHEDITDIIRRDLSVTPLIEIVEVRSAWDTAGMAVSCST